MSWTIAPLLKQESSALVKLANVPEKDSVANLSESEVLFPAKNGTEDTASGCTMFHQFIFKVPSSQILRSRLQELAATSNLSVVS